MGEAFSVDLTNVVGAPVGRGQGTGTVLDDATPTVAFSAPDVAAPERTAEATPLVFTAALSAPSGSDVTVNFANLGTAARTTPPRGRVRGNCTE